jgi:carbamoylphosphate synthase small subunit
MSTSTRQEDMAPRAGAAIKLEQSFSAAESRAGFPAPGLSDLRILMIDNYDSFTYNLVQYLGEISGTRIHVFRNDEVTVDGIHRHGLTHLVVSPGPCTPDDAGVSLQAIAALGSVCPVLGVCLSHQSIRQSTVDGHPGDARPRQASSHPSRQPDHLRRPPSAVRRHPVPLAGG